MYDNNSAKNFSYVGIGKVIAIFFQALFYLIFAALLEPEKYGELNVILATAGTFATFSRFGLNYSLQIYQAKDNTTLSEQIKTLFTILTSIAALILIPIDILAAVLCVGISFFIMNQQNLLGLQQYKKFMINAIVRSILFFIIPFSLYFVISIPGIVLGMAIANLIGSIPFIRDLKIKSINSFKQYYKIFFQNYIIDLSGLATLIDKLLISYLFGLFVVGIYQFNLQIFLAMGALPGVLGSYLISEESKGEPHKKITNLVILSSAVLAIIVVLFSPIFVNEFFPKYSRGILSLQILVLSIIPQTIGTIFTSKLLSKESTKVGYISLAYVGLLLTLISFLGRIYGLEGLAFAVLLSTIIYTILNYILYQNSKQSFQKNKS